MMGSALCETAHIIWDGTKDPCGIRRSWPSIGYAALHLLVQQSDAQRAGLAQGGGGIAEKAEIPYTVAIPAIQTVARPIAVFEALNRLRCRAGRRSC